MATTEESEHGERVTRWERRLEVPMLLLAGAFLAAYAWPVLESDLEQAWESRLEVLSWTVWAAFAIDFLIRLWLAENRPLYAARRWYDVVLVLLPMFRTLRLLRMLALIRMLNRSMAGALAGRISAYVAVTAALTVFVGAITVLDAEQQAPGANITEFGDALWWAMATVTTVGYGDYYPVTGEGRLVAVGLMLIGIALVGVVTAAVASWFVRSAQESSETARKAAKSEDTAESAPGSDDGGAGSRELQRP
jgi:voltage-gated potassium channel